MNYSSGLQIIAYHGCKNVLLEEKQKLEEEIGKGENEINKDMRAAITTFLRNKEFPREVAYRLDKAIMMRRKASNISQYCDFMEKYGNIKDCFVSLFARTQVATKMFDTIFFDIDAKDISLAADRAEYVLQAMDKFNDTIPRIYFSGHKGFHIYYDYEPVFNRSYSSLVHWLVRQMLLSRVVDSQVLTDNVLRRVVYTKHMSTGLWCVPVERKILQQPRDILKKALECNYESITITPSKKLSAFLSLVKEDVRSNYENNDELSDSMPPCVIDAYGKTLNGLAQHCHRLLFAMYITKFDVPEDSVISMFKAAPDFVLKRTRYQVNYVKRRNIRVYGCKSIVRNQMCPLTSDQRCMCDWYPNINAHLPKMEVKTL